MALSWNPWSPPRAVSGPPPRGHMEWRGASGTSPPAPLPACRVQEEARRGQGSCHRWPAGATLARENTQQRRGGCEGGAPEQPAPPTPSGRLSWGVGETPVLAASGGFPLLTRTALLLTPRPRRACVLTSFMTISLTHSSPAALVRSWAEPSPRPRLRSLEPLRRLILRSKHRALPFKASPAPPRVARQDPTPSPSGT